MLRRKCLLVGIVATRNWMRDPKASHSEKASEGALSKILSLPRR